MPKEMLINVSEGEECRIALLEDGRLEELYMERTSSTSHVGNIYKGKVANVEASIQAAFVDFGMGRNGFLHISDLMPTYFGRKGEDIVETVGKKMARRDRPPIQRCLRRGDEIIVQIIKEGIGTKGPTLSSYLSIPGKHLVMMPGVGKMGVSQKIEDEVERRRLRQILDGLKPPKDVGFIIRTAGVGKSKLEIERDLKYLVRLWEQIEKKRTSSKGPTELYAEGDLVTRTVRDFFSPEIDRIIIDNADVAERVQDVIRISTPRAKNKVELYEDAVPLFHKFGIEREIELMYSRHVPLPSGGSLVIDSTEAIVAIDINSGKFRDHSDAETTAFKTDMEAADEIPRQLKLRDLGGVIICDFIDLRYERNRRELEKRLHDNFKRDRAKTKVLRMSQFGIIEMTRQRMRPSYKRSIYFDCPQCKGAGLVKTPESMSLDVMRRLTIAINDQKVARVELAVCPDVAFYLQNKKRFALADLELKYKKRVIVRPDTTLGLDEMKLELFDSRDGTVVVQELDIALSQHSHKTQLNTKQQPPRGSGPFDGRRDQGRRGPQQGKPQQRDRQDEDQARMEDRFDDEEVEIEPPSAEPEDAREPDLEEDSGQHVEPAEHEDAQPQDPRANQRNDRGDRPGQRGRQPQGQRNDRGGRDGGNRGNAPRDGGNRDSGNRQGANREGADEGNGNREGGNRSRDSRDLARGDGGNRGGGNRGGGNRQMENRGGGRPDMRPRDGDERNRPPQDRNALRPPQGRPDDQRVDRDPIAPRPVGEVGQQVPENRGPNQGGGESEFNEDGTPRRRRRRRGRRGRGRNRQQEGQPNLQGGEQPPQNEGAERGGPDDRDDHDHGERFDHAVDRHDDAPRRQDDFEPLGEAPGEITDDHDEATTVADREPEQNPSIEAPESEQVTTATEAEVVAEPEPAPKPTRRGGRKPAAAKTSKPATTKASAKAEEAPASKSRGSRSAAAPKGRTTRSRKASAATAAEATIAETPATPATRPSRRATSADKHLIDDEPIIPDPPRRPRSSRDLDEIPDDLD